MRWIRRISKFAPKQPNSQTGSSLECPRCGAYNVPGSRFCNQCGLKLTDQPAPLQTQRDERRVVTIVFADLVGSTELADQMDPEDLRQLLARYFSVMSGALRRHGALVEKFIGDAVMGVFGLPRAHEDDPARAVRAALEMLQELQIFNDEHLAEDPTAKKWEMRIGINTGEVAASVTASEGSDFIVTGDVVNVAARLQQTAEANMVVVGPRAWRSTQSIVEYAPLGLVALKGKPKPIQVWRAIRMLDTNPVPLARTGSLDTPKTPQIGRDSELTLMGSVTQRACVERKPQYIAVIGEPGTGKTRLAREFIAHELRVRPDLQVMMGRCALYGQDVTFWPLAEMIRNYYTFTNTVPLSQAQQIIREDIQQRLGANSDQEQIERILLYIAYTIGLNMEDVKGSLAKDPKTLQRELFRAWREYFEIISSSGPLLLFIDDIHWADDLLLDVFEHIAERAKGAIIAIGAARPEFLLRRSSWGSGRNNFALITLDRLSDSDTERLFDTLLKNSSVPTELRQNILERAEGNPFFLEEIIRMLTDREIIKLNADGVWEVAANWNDTAESVIPVIPDTVQGALAARIDLLDPEDRNILFHAAIIGRTFWPAAILGISQSVTPEALPACLEQLIARELIVRVHETLRGPAQTETLYMFKHVLTRDVAYDLIPRARRAHEHERFAQWLEAQPRRNDEENAELLANHYEEYYRQAGLARSRDTARASAIRTKILGYLNSAAEKALERFSAKTAIHLYTREINLLADARPLENKLLLTAYIKRGDTRSLRSEGSAAWNDYREALRSYRLMQQTPQTETEKIAAIELGISIYRRLVILPARYSSWFTGLPAHEEIQNYLNDGLKLAESANEEDSLERAAMLTATAFFWWSWPEKRGAAEIQKAIASAEEAVALAEKHEAPRHASEALDALGNLLAVRVDLLGYLRSQARRLFWANHIEDRSEVIDIHCEVSMGHQITGAYDQALLHAETALEMAAAIENDLLQAQALQRILITQYEQDRWIAAAKTGEKLLKIGPKTSIVRQNHYRWGILAYATALVKIGKIDLAHQALHSLDDLPYSDDTQYTCLFRARFFIAQGKYAEAEPILQTALALRAGRHSYPALLAEKMELAARMGTMNPIQNYGEQTLHICEQSGARKPYGQALRAYAIYLMAQNQPELLESASAYLEKALAIFTDIKTQWEIARTQYVLAGYWQKIGGESEQEDLLLNEALKLFESAGSVRDIARARSAIAGNKISLP